MSKVSDFTYQQLGGLLIAVGTAMTRYKLCAQATLDGHGNSQLFDTMADYAIPHDVAAELVTLDLHEVVDYVVGYPLAGG